MNIKGAKMIKKQCVMCDSENQANDVQDLGLSPNPTSGELSILGKSGPMYWQGVIVIACLAFQEHWCGGQREKMHAQWAVSWKTKYGRYSNHGRYLSPGLHRLVLLLWMQNPQWYNFQGLFRMSTWTPKQEIKNSLPLKKKFIVFFGCEKTAWYFPFGK